MASLFRRAGAKVARFIRRIGDPASAANETKLYTKIEGGLAMLFAVRSDGTIDRLGPVLLYQGSTGAVPVSGGGSRFMWAPAKRAFRAGVVVGTEWDDANVGDVSFAFGTSTQARAANSGAIGDNAVASAAHAFAMGDESLANRIGQFSQANGQLVANGDAQHDQLVVRNNTIDATVTVLTIDGAAPAGTVITTSNRIILEDDSTYMFQILVSARRTDANDESAGYQLLGVIDRNVGAGTTALVGAVDKTAFEDTPAWDANVVAETATAGSLEIQVTGEAAKSISWVAHVRLVKVKG